MRVIKDIQKLKNIKSAIITIGNFDGVHTGHQQILKVVNERAAKYGLPSIVYTFEPHPLKILAPHKSPPLLTTLKEKIALIKKYGIDYLILAQFTKEFASQHPKKFVMDVLVGKLKASEIWIGHDYAFGRGKEGTALYLKELGKELDFKVHIIPAYKKKGVIVSSSKIREFIQNGKLKEAANFMGRPYIILGRVVKGRSMGKKLGFPTANLEISNELVPPNGVYAVYVTGLGKKIYHGVANIGLAPTFGANKFVIEVHIIDFKKEIYGKKIKVEFIKKLRNEKVFRTTEGLVAQIMKDIEQAKKVV